MTVTVTTYGQGDNAVAVEHEGDWSGDAVLLWRGDGGRYKRGVLPGRILHAIVESVRAEVLLSVTAEMLDAATDKLADTEEAVVRLSTEVEKSSLRPPAPVK